MIRSRFRLVCIALGFIAPMVMCLALFVRANAAEIEVAQTVVGQQESTPTINSIMRRAMTQGLCQSVIKGKASDHEIKELLELFHELNRLSPPQGSLEKWHEITHRLITVTESISAGKPMQNELRVAANCVNCHREHRPGKKSGG